ncbi:hypothetical protein EV361DRAFT_123488 [Lentinula raphanica]|nr:hypothetical protein EV361DRAFT_123488 [Lentinula raphanica]
MIFSFQFGTYLLDISFLPPFKSVILIAVMVLVTTLKTLLLYILFPILFGVTVPGHPILSERVTSMQPTQDQADGLRIRSPLANAPEKKVPTTPYAIRFSYKDYKRIQTIPKLPDNTYDWSVLSLAEKNINWPWEGYHPPLSITVSDSMALGHIDLLRGDISLSKGDARRALDEKLDQVPFQGYIGHTRAAMSLLRDERYIPAALVTSFLKGTQEIADKEAEALKEMYRSMVYALYAELGRTNEDYEKRVKFADKGKQKLAKKEAKLTEEEKQKLTNLKWKFHRLFSNYCHSYGVDFPRDKLPDSFGEMLAHGQIYCVGSDGVLRDDHDEDGESTLESEFRI